MMNHDYALVGLIYLESAVQNAKIVAVIYDSFFEPPRVITSVKNKIYSSLFFDDIKLTD